MRLFALQFIDAEAQQQLTALIELKQAEREGRQAEARMRVTMRFQMRGPKTRANLEMWAAMERDRVSCKSRHLQSALLSLGIFSALGS